MSESDRRRARTRLRRAQVRRRRLTALTFIAVVSGLSTLTGLASGEEVTTPVTATETEQASTGTDCSTVTEPTPECPSTEPPPSEPPPSEPPPSEPPPSEPPPPEPSRPDPTPSPAPEAGNESGGDPAPAAPQESGTEPAPAATPPTSSPQQPAGQVDRSEEPRGEGPGTRRRDTRGRAPRSNRRARQHARRWRSAVRRRQQQARQRKLAGAHRTIRGIRGRPLPDPLPPAKRLDPEFAQMLVREARRQDVDWPLLLAVLRARGNDDRIPASRAAVRALARQLRTLGAGEDPRRALIALSTRTPFGQLPTGLELSSSDAFADRVIALARYNRAVGLDGLVQGLDAVQDDLERRVLANGSLAVYPGGRSDIQSGRITGRVLVLLLYLARAHDSVTVTSLKSGHDVHTTSGNISAHSYGHAVDIAALDGLSITGNQQPGGITERALRAIMLLPVELRPRQLISLFELGGPSFAMADHHDHIHAGY